LTAVVVEFKPGVLVGGPSFQLRDWPEVLSPRETLDLIRTTGGATFATELLAGALLPSFRARHDLRDVLRSALRGEAPRVRHMNATCRRNWTVNGGANVAPRRPDFTGAVSEAEHRQLLSHGFNAH